MSILSSVVLQKLDQKLECKDAAISKHSRLSRQQLRDQVIKCAAELREIGIYERTAVLLNLVSSVESLIAFLAVLETRAVPVLVPPNLGQRELKHIAKQIDCFWAIVSSSLNRKISSMQITDQTVIVSPGQYENVYEIQLSCSDFSFQRKTAFDVADDTVFFLLSGGTTGFPKLIPRTHRDYLINIFSSAKIAEVSSNSKYLCALPMMHNFALGCPGVLGILSNGGTVVFPSSQSNASLIESIICEGITHTAVVPGIALEIAKQAGHNLKVLQVGGARLFNQQAEAVQQSLLSGKLQQVYGMAEGLLNFTRLDDSFDVITKTQGRPMLPDDEVQLLTTDENDLVKRVPPTVNAVGELLTRGPCTITGYYNCPQANETSFTDDGLYRSGDIVRVDKSGNFIVIGRTSEWINKGGEKISIIELEELIIRHSSIVEVAVAPIPDSYYGEKIGVFIVSQEDKLIKLRDIRKFLRNLKISSYKLPDLLFILEEIPKTPVGKIDRQALASYTAPNIKDLR